MQKDSEQTALRRLVNVTKHSCGGEVPNILRGVHHIVIPADAGT